MAYDFARCRRACWDRGIAARIARREAPSKERLGRHRWVVERTLAWLHRFRRLAVRYERRPDIPQRVPPAKLRPHLIQVRGEFHPLRPPAVRRQRGISELSYGRR